MDHHLWAYNNNHLTVGIEKNHVSKAVLKVLVNLYFKT